MGNKDAIKTQDEKDAEMFARFMEDVSEYKAQGGTGGFTALSPALWGEYVKAGMPVIAGVVSLDSDIPEGIAIIEAGLEDDGVKSVVFHYNDGVNPFTVIEELNAVRASRSLKAEGADNEPIYNAVREQLERDGKSVNEKVGAL